MFAAGSTGLKVSVPRNHLFVGEDLRVNGTETVIFVVANLIQWPLIITLLRRQAEFVLYYNKGLISGQEIIIIVILSKRISIANDWLLRLTLDPS